MFNVIEQAIRTKNPGLAILVDFEKALDSVSFSFIQKTLEIFGFGDNFRKWINILLGISSTRKRFVCVSIVNGYPTTQFKIRRWCRQGGPIAGYLFILFNEILALTLKNSKITPYETTKGNKKLNDTYADDITILKTFPTSKKQLQICPRALW